MLRMRDWVLSARSLHTGKLQHDMWLRSHGLKLWKLTLLNTAKRRENGARATRFSLRLILNRGFKGLKMYLSIRRRKRSMCKMADRDCRRIKRCAAIHRWRRMIHERQVAMERLRTIYNLLYRTIYYRCFVGLKSYWEYKLKKAQDITNGQRHHVRSQQLHTCSLNLPPPSMISATDPSSFLSLPHMWIGRMAAKTRCECFAVPFQWPCQDEKAGNGGRHLRIIYSEEADDKV